eukprot:13316261-Heterocapsa_arctica.AAC.1
MEIRCATIAIDAARPWRISQLALRLAMPMALGADTYRAMSENGAVGSELTDAVVERTALLGEALELRGSRHEEIYAVIQVGWAA